MTNEPKCIDRNEQNQAVIHPSCYIALHVQYIPVFLLDNPSSRLLLPVILGLVEADTNSSDQR
jgi:hypothetical protein